MQMNRENKFCIYWHADKCLLKNISLNDLGICRECISLEIPEAVMEEARQKLLRQYAHEEAKPY